MQTLGGPIYSGAFDVTPSDTAGGVNARALFIGGAGNLAVRVAPGAASVTFTGLVAGQILPLELRAGFVLNTGTTCSGIVGLQ